MASLSELEKSLPAHFTMDNKNLIIIAHVRDETIYFYNELGPNTTIVLLSQPQCYLLKKIFLDFMNDIGTTVIDLRETETFDSEYKLSHRSMEIIGKLLAQNKFEKIITHPKYEKNNDPQNRELYEFVSDAIKKLGTGNHHTYNKNKKNKIGLHDSSKNILCDGSIKKGILELYSRALDPEHKINRKIYDNYITVASNISGTRQLDT